MVENAFATVPTMDPRPVDTLAQRLQVAFDDSGVSVAQVAAACGITPQAIYKWLKGTSDDLAGQQLAKVCDLTGFDPAWIEFGTGPRIRARAVRGRGRFRGTSSPRLRLGVPSIYQRSAPSCPGVRGAALATRLVAPARSRCTMGFSTGAPPA